MRILVVKLHLLGDVLQALHVLRSVRQAHPEAEIDFVTKPAYASLVEDCALATRVFRFPVSESLGAYDLLINMSPDDEAVQWSSRISAERRVGAQLGPDGARQLWGELGVYYASSIMFRQLRRLNLVDLWILHAGLPMVGDADLFSSDEEEERSRAIAQRFAIDPARPLVCLQPGSSFAFRRWPPEDFAAVGKALLRQGYQIAVMGSADEAPLVDEILRAMGGGISTAGLDLAELRAFFRRASLLITNDTGPMHLSSAIGLAHLALFFAASSPIDTGGYRSGNVSIAATVPCAPCDKPRDCTIDFACRSQVTPAVVLAVAEQLLSNDANLQWNENVVICRSTREASGALIQERAVSARPPMSELLREIVAEVWFRQWVKGGSATETLRARFAGVLREVSVAKELRELAEDSARLRDALVRSTGFTPRIQVLQPVAKLFSMLPSLLVMARSHRPQPDARQVAMQFAQELAQCSGDLYAGYCD